MTTLFFLVTVANTSQIYASNDRSLIRHEVENFFARYFGLLQYAFDIEVADKNSNSTTAKKSLFSGNSLPGFPTETTAGRSTDDNQIITDTTTVKITLSYEASKVLIDQKSLQQLLSKRLAKIGVKAVSLKLQDHPFPNTDGKQNELSGLKTEIQGLKEKIIVNESKINDVKTSSQSQVKDLERPIGLWVLGVAILLALSLAGGWFVMRNISKYLSKQISTDMAPLATSLTEGFNGGVERASDPTEQRPQSHIEESIGNKNISFVSIVNELRKEIREHNEGLNLAIDDYLTANNYQCLFLILCAVDQDYRKSIKSKMSENQNSSYLNYVATESKFLLESNATLRKTSDQVIKALWLSEQNKEILTKIQIEEGILSMKSRDRLQFIRSLTQSELRTLSSNISNNTIIKIIASDQEIATPIITALNSTEPFEASLNSIAEKIRAALPKEAFSQDEKVSEIIASLPTDREIIIKNLVGEDVGDYVAMHFDIAFKLIESMSIGDTVDFLSCLEQSIQRRFMAKFPDIKARRIASRQLRSPSERGMNLKSEIIGKIKKASTEPRQSSTENPKDPIINIAS
ncbi:MAG: hypothetical protein NT027_06685 [Proteobacteria bacterium]|nr:hypothetical protein [Pseudomonadota bacterium]